MRFSNEFGFWELNNFPGCNQLIVSNHAFIKKEFRGRGIGTKTHELRLQMAKSLGYDAIICTVKSDNIAQKRILDKSNWVKVFSFMNSETENYIDIYIKDLNTVQ